MHLLVDVFVVEVMISIRSDPNYEQMYLDRTESESRYFPCSIILITAVLLLFFYRMCSCHIMVGPLALAFNIWESRLLI
jgi:hypothetical protein